MKKLLAIIIFILSLPIPSWANDIRDFQIQGVGIGDSLLKIFSEEELKKFFSKGYKNYYPKSKKYFTLTAPSADKNFRQINVDLKDLDKKYIIYGISQYKRSKIEDCLKEKKLVVKEIKGVFSDDLRREDYTKKHAADPTGNSKMYATEFLFKDFSSISIVCVDWGKGLESEGYSDNLDVGMMSSEFRKFLVDEAY